MCGWGWEGGGELLPLFLVSCGHFGSLYETAQGGETLCNTGIGFPHYLTRLLMGT